MTESFLIYGANGFASREAAALAVSQGHRPAMAGRNQAAVEALADALGLEARVFALDQADGMDRALEGVATVLHRAGSYQSSFRPMVEGCLRSRVHYLDLTGELSVHLGLMRYDAEAREKGVMILPGAGFDVVPNDCLAARLHGRLPTATRLTLAFQTRGPRGLPPGTANTVAANLQEPVRVMLDGRVVEAADQARTRMIDFGRGPRLSSLATWGAWIWLTAAPASHTSKSKSSTRSGNDSSWPSGRRFGRGFVSGPPGGSCGVWCQPVPQLRSAPRSRQHLGRGGRRLGSYGNCAHAPAGGRRRLDNTSGAFHSGPHRGGRRAARVSDSGDSLRLRAGA